MSNRLGQNVAVRQAVAPVVQAAGNPAAIVIDTLAAGNTFWDDAVAVLNVGAASGSPDATSVSMKIQDSDDNSHWADAVDESGNAIATKPVGASTVTSISFSRSRLRRYILVMVTVAFTGGTTPAVPVSATLVFGSPKVGPTN